MERDAERGKVIHMEGDMPRILNGGVQLPCEFFLAEDDRAVGTVQGVVRGEGHNVGVRDGGRQQPRRNEADVLTDVDPEIGAHGVRDLSEFCIVRNARIADGREYDEPRFHTLRERRHCVPVHLFRGGIDTEIFEGVVQPRAVLLLASVEREDAVALLQETEEDDA